VRIIIPNDIISAYNDTITNSPKLLETAFNRQVTRLRGRILNALQEDPGPVVYADQGRLRWKSDRQRRAFFATNGFGGGIPYRRTGALQKAYDVRKESAEGGGILLITNSSPIADYVVFDSTQPYHLDTGWPQVADVVVQFEEIATNALIDTWLTVTDPTTGVPT
jgi:hypothetical protein